MKNSKIGLISGMGPLAGSAILHKMLVHANQKYDAVEDCDYPEIVMISHGIDGFNYQAKIDNAFAQELNQILKQINLLSPTILGIGCNTAHLYLNKLRSNTDAEIVNIVEETVRVASINEGLYLLLTSSTSYTTKLYQPYLKKHGVSFEEVDNSSQRLIDHIIELVMSNNLIDAGKKLDHLINKLAPKKYVGIIFGCTELPLAITHSAHVKDFLVIDSSDVLAKTLVDKYYEQLGESSNG